MPDVFNIAEILVSHALRVHQDEIAIIAYCGSYATGQASPTSDLDIYYIPDDGKARSLSSQFIIDGLPYDFWPVSWRFAEDIANARSGRPWAVSASLIADTRVLHHRSEKDLARFNALKARIAELTRPECRPTMVQRALSEFENTQFQLGQMRFALAHNDVPGMRWASRKFLYSAVNCLALINQTYFTRGWGANWSQVLEMAHKPDGLDSTARAILTSQDTSRVLEEANRLAQEVREILGAAQASVSESAEAGEVFKDFYFFVFEYRNKVLSACERGDVMAAGCAAFHLQEEICLHMSKVENGFYGTDFNLLGEYMSGYEQAGFPGLLESASKGDLVELARQVQRLDENVQEWFQSRSIDLNVLDNADDLRRFLNQRDPG
jgi:hypothetical protein